MPGDATLKYWPFEPDRSHYVFGSIPTLRIQGGNEVTERVFYERPGAEVVRAWIAYRDEALQKAPAPVQERILSIRPGDEILYNFQFVTPEAMLFTFFNLDADKRA